MFAKLYETDLGQILVKQDATEEGVPEVRFFFEPEDMGVCSVALSFSDTEAGWSESDKAFNDVDENKAIGIVSGVLERFLSS